ncbi:MAG TPA: hypothetical protein VLH94_04065 [Spirochaetia bacterium]|nr:hypothetical protein [Spirochaetia bacterium]
MTSSQYILGMVVCAFFLVGGMVDYWQSARHHHKPIPYVLEKYFALFWLILYSGVLPFTLIFLASGFNFFVAKTYLGFAFIGFVLWDIVFSLLDKKTLISDQEAYWFWGDKDYPLSKGQVAVWHLIRLIVGMTILMFWR